MNDSTYRGGYFSIHKMTNMRAMFSNMEILPSSAPFPDEIDADAQALFNAMTDAPSDLRKNIINRLIVELKHSSIWTPADTIHVQAAHANQASRLNWKNPAQYAMTPFNSPAFVVDRGWKGDASTSYLGSGFLPATNGVGWTVNDGSIWAWTIDEMQDANPAAGAGTAYIGAVTPRNLSGSAEAILNRTGTVLSVAAASSIGLTGTQRRGASDERLWKNGVQIASGSSSSVGRPTGELRSCGRSPSTFAGNRVGIIISGGSLSGKEPALFSALNTYMQAIGAA